MWHYNCFNPNIKTKTPNLEDELMRPETLIKMFQETNGPAREFVFPSSNFREVVRRERNRSDRHGNLFSIIAFEARDPDDLAIIADHLIPYLAGRIRTTDSIGWIDEHLLGVLLADAPSEGGRKFIRHLMELEEFRKTAINAYLFTYPSDYFQFKKIAREDSDQNNGRQPEDRSTARTQQNIKTVDVSSVFRLSLLRGPGLPAWKRILDITGAALGLVLLSPLFLLMALVIKMGSHGPIFFTQKRVGYLGKEFTFWKFRTMRVNADSSQHQNYVHHLIDSDAPMTKLDSTEQPQMIPFGGLLRKTSLDELPQLINVLLGEMSLVGPRPCLPYEAEKYLRWHAKRFDCVPGMTGLWQVGGKNKITFKEMIRLDIKYAQDLSLWLDLVILFRTVPTVIALALDRSGTLKENFHAGTN